MEKEIWKSIGVFKGIDLTGYYEASNLGRIKRLERLDGAGRSVPEKILSRRPNQNGDVFVPINFNGTTICGTASQYVMNAFHPEHPPEKNRIYHIDGDKTNNRLDNLKWATQKEVCNNVVSTQKQAQKLKEKTIPIVQIDSDDGNFVREYRLRDDLRNRGINPSSIVCLINKGKHLRRGYIWMYKPDYENMTRKELMNLIDRENNHREENRRRNGKPILQLDMDGNLVAEHKSITQASDSVGCSKQAISICLTDPQHHISCMGYIWRYKNKENE